MKWYLTLCLLSVAGTSWACDDPPPDDPGQPIYSFEILGRCSANTGVPVVHVTQTDSLETTQYVFCADSFDDIAATLFCRAKGYIAGSAAPELDDVKPADAQMVSVWCDRTAYDLEQCMPEVDVCSTDMAGGVVCSGDPDNFPALPPLRDDDGHGDGGGDNGCLREGCHCENNPDDCDWCIEGYGTEHDWNKNTFKCMDCNSVTPGCVECWGDTYGWKECTKCDAGLKRDDNCMSCTNEACSAYCNICEADGTCDPSGCTDHAAFNPIIFACEACPWGCGECFYEENWWEMQCIQCLPGFYETSWGCEMCGERCQECDENGSCLRCAEGYDQADTVIWNNTGMGYFAGSGCSDSACPRNCRSCESDTICDDCLWGSTLTEDRQCELCSETVDGCLTCHWELYHDENNIPVRDFMCSECMYGRYYNRTAGECLACSDYHGFPNCASCSSRSYYDSGLGGLVEYFDCRECAEGFYFNWDGPGKCEPEMRTTEADASYIDAQKARSANYEQKFKSLHQAERHAEIAKIQAKRSAAALSAKAGK